MVRPLSPCSRSINGGQDQVGLAILRYDLGKRTLPSFRTTPESVDVYALLAQMVGYEAVIEVSSHGIDQKYYGLDVDVAAFESHTGSYRLS